MIQRFFIIIVVLSSFSLSAQNLSPVEELLVRTNMASQRDTTLPLSAQLIPTKVTGFQLLITFKVDSVSDSSDVVIEIGSSQTTGNVFNKSHKFKYHSSQPTQRCFHTDENPDVEIGPINYGYAIVNINLTPQQYADAKWANVYVKKNQQQSQKKHFQIK